MSAPTRLEALLILWEEGHDRGRPMSAEELCRECPDLLPELRRRIAALLESRRAETAGPVGGLDRSGGPPCPATAEPAETPAGGSVSRMDGSRAVTPATEDAGPPSDLAPGEEMPRRAG